MFKTVLKSELRNITRDKMYIFFFIFPVIMGLIGYFLIPYIKDNVAPGNPAPQIVAMFLILMTGYIFGAITGFTILDDKDDNVLMSLKITPISVRFYVILKLIMSYIFGFIATLLLVVVTDFLPGASFFSLLLISAIGALQGPGLALIVNSFSKNKVEGFVIMKLSGLLLMVPVLAFFIQGWEEIFLIITPGFWPGRMIHIEMMDIGMLPYVETNFTFIVYFIVGVVYNMGFLTLLMKLHNKKANI
jgi:fluoroquinolone transport system permease protein